MRKVIRMAWWLVIINVVSYGVNLTTSFSYELLALGVLMIASILSLLALSYMEKYTDEKGTKKYFVSYQTKNGVGNATLDITGTVTNGVIKEIEESISTTFHDSKKVVITFYKEIGK